MNSLGLNFDDIVVKCFLSVCSFGTEVLYTSLQAQTMTDGETTELRSIYCTGHIVPNATLAAEAS